MKITPTQEQQTLKVAALAGTGKTSTLMMIAEAYPERRGLYLAYNKSMQLDAQAKFPDWIDCRTVSMAWRIRVWEISSDTS